MWLFCLLDPFIPTQIKFLATPLQAAWTFNTVNFVHVAAVYLAAYCSQLCCVYYTHKEVIYLYLYRFVCEPDYFSFIAY